MQQYESDIRHWYMNEYKSDELGKDIKGDATFKKLFVALVKGYDVYTVLGVSDSVIRERVFAKLADILGINYTFVYNLWIKKV